MELGRQLKDHKRIYANQPEVVARSAVSRTEVREEGREMLLARSQEPASARRLPPARRASAEVVVSIPGVNTRTFIEPRSRTDSVPVQLPRLRTLPDTSHTRCWLF